MSEPLNPPLVSIITPCYNHELYLDDYFNGLLNQTYSNVQLIIIDDGSTDNSWNKISQYQEALKNKFSHVICKRQSNVGAHKTIERGVSLATGKYLSILESDDYYLPTKIEENVNYLEARPEMGLVHSDYNAIENGRIIEKRWQSVGQPISQGRVFEDLLTNNFILTASFCCRTDLLKKYVRFDKYISRAYRMTDCPMFLDLSLHTQFGYIDKALVCYRILPESASRSRNPRKKFLFIKSYYQMRLDYMEEYCVSDEVRHKALNLKWYYSWLFYEGYKLFIPDSSLEGYNWLVRNYSEEYDNLSNQVRVASLKSPILWFIVYNLDRLEILHRSKDMRRIINQNIFSKIFFNDSQNEKL